MEASGQRFGFNVLGEGTSVCFYIEHDFIEQGSESWNSVLINLCIFFMVLLISFLQ